MKDDVEGKRTEGIGFTAGSPSSTLPRTTKASKSKGYNQVLLKDCDDLEASNPMPPVPSAEGDEIIGECIFSQKRV